MIREIEKSKNKMKSYIKWCPGFYTRDGDGKVIYIEGREAEVYLRWN